MLFYEGPVWYRREFNYRKREGTRVFVYFGAANYRAVIRVTRNVGFFITKRPTEGYEYVLTLALVSIAMGALGPGQWSLDDALDIVVDGWEGFAVAAGIGLLGGAAFLAMFWRPPKPEEAAAA